METRMVRLIDLQPTHIPRSKSINFLKNLSREELEKLGLPQIWETPEGLLISDGNNRCLRYASLGLHEIEVDYCREDGPYGFLIRMDELKDMAKHLRERLIFSPYDLCRTRDGLVFEQPMIDVYSD